MRKFLLLLFLLITASVRAGELSPYSGAILPDFTLSDLDGNKHTLSSYRGKVVMVNFWATYCSPCIKEMPSIQRLKEKMAGKPFAILSIDMAEERHDVQAFLTQHQIKIDFPVLLNPEGNVVEEWMITAVPTTFVIDPKGTIRYALFGGIEWDKPDVIETISGLIEQKQ
jgi:thiol-disulfide isomerase/thioredoxin